jgi:hypothetical protein
MADVDHKIQYRRPSLFAGVTFQENTANIKTANTKSNNDLKIGVPFLIFKYFNKKAQFSSVYKELFRKILGRKLN